MKDVTVEFITVPGNPAIHARLSTGRWLPVVFRNRSQANAWKKSEKWRRYLTPCPV